eukprot:6598508-Pyramimonas_sp.AAC.1
MLMSCIAMLASEVFMITLLMVGTVQYNPQHAWGERCEDLSRELKQWQMITLTGTKRRADWEHPAAIQQLSHYWAIHGGWIRSGW